MFNIIRYINLYRIQWKPIQVTKKIQERKLKNIICHAYKKVPFYHNLFNTCNILPEDICTIKNLKNFPVISKTQLVDVNFEERISCNINLKKCDRIRTSGSTGLPLEIIFTRRDTALKNLYFLRTYLALGILPWYRWMEITTNRAAAKKRPLYNFFGLLRSRRVCYLDPPEKWISDMLRWKPHVLMGDVAVLKLAAEIIQKKDIREITPKIILSWGGILDNYTKEYLSSVYKGNVVEIYGCQEAGIIAWLCKRCNGYHINADNVIVEIMNNGKEARPGEGGEVLVTTLNAYAMPFIRYKVGDRVLLSDRNPVCGRKFPLLKTILGRNDDIVLLKNGEKIPSQPFYHAIEKFEGIHRWQIVQKDNNNLVLLIESNKDFKKESVEKIKKKYIEITKNQINIKVNVVDKIKFNPEQKYRSVISHTNSTLL